MIRYLMVFPLTVLFGCATPTVKPEQAILGVWHLKDRDRSGYTMSHMAYIDGGKKCEIAVEISSAGVPAIRYYLNTWAIKDGVMTSTIDDSSVPYIPNGTVIRDVIHKLDDDEFVVLMEKTTEYTPSLERHTKIHDLV